MNISSTVIICPIDGPVQITAEVQDYKGEKVVMVERIFKDMRRRVTYMSVKQSIATNNLLNNLELPKVR